VKTIVLAKTALLLIAISSFAGDKPTPDAGSHEFFDAITRADKTMFDAFNAHDVDLLMSMFTDDVEFLSRQRWIHRPPANTGRIHEDVR
jgi:hypothetical protein